MKPMNGENAGRLKGFMIDAPRLVESMSYYHRVIDFCAQWNLNAIIFRLTDDEGSALRFKSHLELLTHQHALTTAEARDLVAHAETRGIQLIPEIESFGHTRYITSVPRYAEMADKSPHGDPNKDGFSGLIPVHPGSLKLMEDLYQEAASIFSSPYLHGGCDEVQWGGSEMSRKALEGRKRPEIWAEYLNQLNRFAEKLGKQLIVWADHILRHEPEILNYIDKTIILHDWDYGEKSAKVLERFGRKAIQAGLRIIGGPSLIWCKWGPRPGRDQLRNIDAYADAYGQIKEPGCLGIIATNWVPGRYIQNSIWDGVAYTAIAITESSAKAREEGFSRFIRQHYGASWDTVWADVFFSLYDSAPGRLQCARGFWPILPVPWADEAQLRKAAESGSATPPPFARLRSQLVLCEASVIRNRDDFDAFYLSVEYLEHLHWRESVVRAFAKNSGKPSVQDAATLFAAIAERDRRIYSKLKAEWDAGRPSDILSILNWNSGANPEDWLFPFFKKAADFSELMAKDPAKFIRCLDLS